MFWTCFGGVLEVFQHIPEKKIKFTVPERPAWRQGVGLEKKLKNNLDEFPAQLAGTGPARQRYGHENLTDQISFQFSIALAGAQVVSIDPI